MQKKHLLVIVGSILIISLVSLYFRKPVDSKPALVEQGIPEPTLAPAPSAPSQAQSVPSPAPLVPEPTSSKPAPRDPNDSSAVLLTSIGLDIKLNSLDDFFVRLYKGEERSSRSLADKYQEALHKTFSQEEFTKLLTLNQNPPLLAYYQREKLGETEVGRQDFFHFLQKVEQEPLPAARMKLLQNFDQAAKISEYNFSTMDLISKTQRGEKKAKQVLTEARVKKSSLMEIAKNFADRPDSELIQTLQAFQDPLKQRGLTLLKDTTLRHIQDMSGGK